MNCLKDHRAFSYCLMLSKITEIELLHRFLGSRNLAPRNIRMKGREYAETIAQTIARGKHAYQRTPDTEGPDDSQPFEQLEVGLEQYDLSARDLEVDNPRPLIELVDQR